MTSERARTGSASTDDLRNAMLQYRALFEELVARSPDSDELGTGRIDRHGTAGTTPDGTSGNTSGREPGDGAVAADAAAPTDSSAPAGTAVPDSAVTGDAVPPQRSTRG